MADYERLITVLVNEEGYREGYSNGHWNNDQKYSDETPGLGWSDYQAWCATLMSWGSFKTNIKIPGCPTASVWAIYQAGLAENRFTEYPVKGAVVIMGRNTHTGLCIDYNATHITTLEGNTNTTGSAEGNGVYIRKRLRRDPFITGYVVPYFPDGVYVSPDPAWNNTSPTSSSSTPLTGDKDMHVITAPNREAALIGPGYVYLIPDAEQVEQLGNLHGRINGNDRQYDIWRAGAEQGHLASAPSTPPVSAPAVDVDALAAALLRKVITP